MKCAVCKRNNSLKIWIGIDIYTCNNKHLNSYFACFISTILKEEAWSISVAYACKWCSCDVVLVYPPVSRFGPPSLLLCFWSRACPVRETRLWQECVNINFNELMWRERTHLYIRFCRSAEESWTQNTTNKAYNN